MSKESSKLLIADKPDSKEYRLGYKLAGLHRGNQNVLLGRLLTIVESSLADTAQAKAMKDLVKREVWHITDETQKGIYLVVNGDEYHGPAVSMSDDGRMN